MLTHRHIFLICSATQHTERLSLLDFIMYDVRKNDSLQSINHVLHVIALYITWHISQINGLPGFYPRLYIHPTLGHKLAVVCTFGESSWVEINHIKGKGDVKALQKKPGHLEKTNFWPVYVIHIRFHSSRFVFIINKIVLHKLAPSHFLPHLNLDQVLLQY